MFILMYKVTVKGDWQVWVNPYTTRERAQHTAIVMQWAVYHIIPTGGLPQ